jgi:hypothetical protein
VFTEDFEFRTTLVRKFNMKMLNVSSLPFRELRKIKEYRYLSLSMVLSVCDFSFCDSW